MLHGTHGHDNFRLDEDGFAVPAADWLADWFIEHSDDPDEGDPAAWPSWCDDIAVRLGSAMCRSECFDVLPDDDQVYPF